MPKAIQYSPEELQFIKNHCTLPRREAWTLFQKKFDRYDISKDHFCGLCKRKGWLTGRTGYFEKGHIPDPSSHPRGPNKTSFKKGNKPANWLPVGSERITSDGYVLVKTGEGINQYRLKQRLVYEKHYGTIPRDHVVRFKDGNRMNYDIDNLFVVSRAENWYLTSDGYNNSPEEIKPAIQGLAKLQATLNAQVQAGKEQ